MSEVLRGSLDVLLLGMIDTKPDHGYGLMRRLREAGEEDLSDGALYPALARLEASGKTEGDWSTGPNGRQRKVFRLTEKGRNQLRRARNELPAFLQRLTMILGAPGA